MNDSPRQLRARRRRARTRWLRRAAAPCIVATLLAACSSNSSGSGESGPNSPIVVGIATGIQTSEVTFGPGAVAALQAFANALNKSGGINGHPMQIITCDTRNQPNLEISCARQAVSHHVVAMLGSNIVYQGDEYEKILSAANIADVENTGPLPSNYKGNTFPVTWETGSFMPCVSQAIGKASGGTSVVVVQNVVSQVSTLFDGLMANGAKKSGLRWLDPINAPAGASDFAPYVAQAQNSGADIVIEELLGAGPQAFVRASSAAGAKYAICTAVGLSGSGGWTGTGPAEGNVYVGATFAPLTSDVPLMKKFLADLAAERAAGNDAADTSPAHFQAQTMGAWLAGHTFAQVASKIPGTVTANNFLKAIAGAQVTFGGIIPDVNFAAPAEKGGPYEHVYGSSAYLWKWSPTNGTYSNEGEIQDTFQFSQG